MATNTLRRKIQSPRKSRAQSQTTTNPKVIQSWVEARGGHPATVVGTSRKGEPGLLRIDYPGFRGQQKLRAINWNEFFNKFKQSDLAFVFQNKTATGRVSRFSKFVRRQTASRKKAA